MRNSNLRFFSTTENTTQSHRRTSVPTVGVCHVGGLQDVANVLHGQLRLGLHSLLKLPGGGVHPQLARHVQGAVHQHPLTAGTGVRSGQHPLTAGTGVRSAPPDCRDRGQVRSAPPDCRDRGQVSTP